MSDLDRLQADVTSLPEEVQQTVIEFVSFLKQPSDQPAPIASANYL